MKRVWSAILIIVLLLGGGLVAGCTPSNPNPDLEKAIEYLFNSYNPALRLLYESPNYNPDTYWLVGDNLLAMYVLQEYHPEISHQIRNRLIELADEYNLPQNKDRLPISFYHEAFIGEIIHPSFREPKEYVLDIKDGHTLKTVIYDGESLVGWEEYADLLLCAALNKHHIGDSEGANEYLHMAVEMWDGQGLADANFEKCGGYSTYKLGLLLLASKTIGYPLNFEDGLLSRLKALQTESGGFFTNYYPDGKPYGDTNTETTAIVLLGLTGLRNEENEAPPAISPGVPLVVEVDEEGTGYCEVSQLITYREKVYAFIAPKGKILVIDPITRSSEVVYSHPYAIPAKWRATAWGACVNDIKGGVIEENLLFFAGWGADAEGNYRPYIFKSFDGNTFNSIKLGDFWGEAYSIFEFRNDELDIMKLFAFVTNFAEQKTLIFSADLQADPTGETWEKVDYEIDSEYKVVDAIEWAGHLWAVGSSLDPGAPSNNGVIIHYNPDTGSWEYFTYDRGFNAIGEYYMEPTHMIILGDTDGWLWVTYSMPPDKDKKLIKLDAPILRIAWLGNWVFDNASQLIVSTGLRNGWGSLWLIDSSVFSKRLAQNAYGGISAFAPFYNGIIYGTSWDLPGWDYDVQAHKLGGKYSPSASIDIITPKEIAEQSAPDREPMRHIIWSGETVEANTLSDTIPGAGWQEMVLNFTTDTDGSLTIMADAGIAPANARWMTVKTIEVAANQPIAEKLEICGTRYRLSFSNSANISAVAYLYP